ncbi:hypothetical protein [Pseudonocardia sp. HH130630-07]|uniref:hypothetical protein n=1 Tax=Pseudonocardia sp. HH130630-07 TaxID=1690815 RepID=UPI001E4D8DCB|nr:hypothetical protein [Pseudonocardia sp. HH130630-07]
MKLRTSGIVRSRALEKNCQIGSSNGTPTAIPISTVPAAVTFGTPTATIAGIPTTPASSAAGAEPVTVPTIAATPSIPSATTTGRSPANSTVLRTRVFAIAVSRISDPSHEPRRMAIIVAASFVAPSCMTASRTPSSPVSGAPAANPIPTASPTSTNAVGTFPLRITATPAAMIRRITMPMSGPPCLQRWCRVLYRVRRRPPR